jgi:hypothetical protein
VFVYDRGARGAGAIAETLRDRLPTGYLVIAAQDLPGAGVLHLTPDMVRGSWAWVEADATVHHGRRGHARALRACGGGHAALGNLVALPGVGRLAERAVASRPAR